MKSEETWCPSGLEFWKRLVIVDRSLLIVLNSTILCAVPTMCSYTCCLRWDSEKAGSGENVCVDGGPLETLLPLFRNGEREEESDLL